MKRSFKSFLAVIAICLILMAVSLPLTQVTYAATSNLFDYAGTLDEYEAEDLDAYLAARSQELQFDIVVLTISEGFSSDDLLASAEDFYDNNGFGYGPNRDGIILAVDMTSSQLILCTTGFGIEAVTEYGEEVIYDYIMDDMSDGDFASAYEKFEEVVYDFVKLARNGDPVDWDTPGYPSYPWYEGVGGGTDPVGPDGPDEGPTAGEAAAASGAGALAVGAAAGAISSGRNKSKLKTVRGKTQANSYERQGSLVLSDRRERFLYSTVAVSPRTNANDQNRGHGQGPRTSGTRVHIGSSGTPHGGGAGGGRKF
ncbi:MAG: TPM domain-containing protein [Firmicutes bacterium]|nr:TPM domain-containing protein [Bacillota bacterium]